MSIWGVRLMASTAGLMAFLACVKASTPRETEPRNWPPWAIAIRAMNMLVPSPKRLHLPVPATPLGSHPLFLICQLSAHAPKSVMARYMRLKEASMLPLARPTIRERRIPAVLAALVASRYLRSIIGAALRLRTVLRPLKVSYARELAAE